MAGGMKVRVVVRARLEYSGVLRYQSGVLIRTPPSNNNLLTELGIGPANNPALWGGGTTF